MKPRDRNDLHAQLANVRIVPPEREPGPRPEPTPTRQQESFWQQLVDSRWSFDHGERPGVYWHGAVGCGKTFLAEPRSAAGDERRESEVPTMQEGE